LIGATSFAAEFNEGGVFVAMHENESDDTIAIHSGMRVRKNHTSRRDAFQSIDVPVVARVNNGKIDRNSQFPKTVLKGKIKEEFKLQTRFNPNVALVKFYPGLDTSLFDFLSIERETKGFIVEGTGLGHVSSKIVEKISDLAKQEIFFGITSQCIRGHVDLHVYETGIDLIKAGAVSLGNMLSETALVKLSWALGNFEWDQIKDIMSRNLVGEMTERILLR
jgi:glutamyl-tRNA(Gln) amidotransferase subunit D